MFALCFRFFFTMKIIWTIFTFVFVLYIDCCICANTTLDKEEDIQSIWSFSHQLSYIYGQNLTVLEANIAEDKPSPEMPEKFWDEFNISKNANTTGIWAWMYYKIFDDPTPSITLSSYSLTGSISLSYFIYGNGYITVSADHNYKETIDNCEDRPPELVITSKEQDTDNTTTTTTTTTEPPVDLRCNTKNREWNHKTIDFLNCNQTVCTGGVMTFTVTFHFEDTTDNFTTNGGFIFLDKIVAVEYVPPPPTVTPTPSPNTTTSTTTEKTTESTTESLSTPLTPGFSMIVLTLWTMIFSIP